MARELVDVDIKGLGRFLPEPAAFRCTRYHLPEPWDYVYTNGDALLRINHTGAGYLQIDPPGGPALFRPERGETTPLMLVWLLPEGRSTRAFTNFYCPTLPLTTPGTEPDDYACTFAPDHACFTLRQGPWQVETRLWVPAAGASVVLQVRIENRSRQRQRLNVMPALRPHLAPFSLAPWDVPHNYQTAAFCRVGHAACVWMETRNPGGDPSKRLRAAALTDLKPTTFEVAGHAFMGTGAWTAPAALWQGRLTRSCTRQTWRYGSVTQANAVVSQPIVAAWARRISCAPGKAFSFSLAYGKLPDQADGSLPPVASVRSLARLLKAPAQERSRAQIRKRYASLFNTFRLETPDPALNRYAMEWLPLQLDWVLGLDRGWPTGMRGTRDSAQDVTAAVLLAPQITRARLLELFAVQRTDGWFVRQYSTSGPQEQHDERAYVDSAIWVWECLWEYLCQTRDVALLKRKVRWLDQRQKSTLLEHAQQLFAYYLAKENLGEHGLCKIREGDWNDSVNRAGVLGRGESVMVTCQVVLGLEQAADLLQFLASQGRPGLKRKVQTYRAAAKRLRDNLRRAARNRKGYFNGVFNDAGQWVFSPRDPDGKARISGPANSFAVASGVVRGRECDKIFRALDQLKGKHGWYLFHPGIGQPPIANLGRVGSGDLAIGIAENGTCYNHGCHGFLGRAAFIAGRGDMLYEILRYMLPYDQRAHPIHVCKTAPYGVVNHWKELPGLDGHGGDTFLSGSISTAIRNLYQGMVGFRPQLDHLLIDPVVPAKWRHLEAELPFLGAHFRILVDNPDRVQAGVKACRVDGEDADGIERSPRLCRSVARIPLETLRRGKDCEIQVRLGV